MSNKFLQHIIILAIIFNFALDTFHPGFGYQFEIVHIDDSNTKYSLILLW